MPSVTPKRIQGAVSVTSAKESAIPTISQVMGEVNGLDEALTDLSQLLNRLSERLVPVLRESDDAQCEGKLGPSPSAPLAQLLQSHLVRLENCNNLTRDLLHRLEL